MSLQEERSPIRNTQSEKRYTVSDSNLGEKLFTFYITTYLQSKIVLMVHTSCECEWDTNFFTPQICNEQFPSAEMCSTPARHSLRKQLHVCDIKICLAFAGRMNQALYYQTSLWASNQVFLLPFILRAITKHTNIPFNVRPWYGHFLRVRR